MPKAKTKFNKKIAVFIVVLIVIGFSIFLFKDKLYKPAPKQTYEVAVMMRSQNNKDPEEDARTSLKKGDCLVIQKEGHKWSKTEKVSYLILKMELTEEQVQKLSQSKTQEIKEKDLSQEEQDRIVEEKKRAKDEKREYMPEPREKTLIAREYYIDFEKDEVLKNLEANDLIKGQPLMDRIFDWGIVRKK
jgi:hypothetical protein